MTAVTRAPERECKSGKRDPFQQHHALSYHACSRFMIVDKAPGKTRVRVAARDGLRNVDVTVIGP